MEPAAEVVPTSPVKVIFPVSSLVLTERVPNFEVEEAVPILPVKTTAPPAVSIVKLLY